MVRVLAPFVCVVTLAVCVATPARAQSPSLLIEDMTWTEVRDAIAAGKTTAVYYAGSIEQNGPGMALGKHLFLAHYIAQKIAEQLGNALVYPTMPFAPTGDPTPDHKTGHMRFAGSVNVSDEAFGLIARGIAESARAAGFKNVVMMSDHGGGGQTALENVAKDLNATWSPAGVHVYYIRDTYFKEKEQMRAYAAEHKIAVDSHAGFDDTSQVMFIDRDHKWIRKDKLVTDDGKGGTGVTGDQTIGTVALGEMFVGYKIKDAVDQIRSLVK
jgi:creatinine amidohydrolase/Fe(II)-dependent formamide hydrolase-like protein